MAIPAMWSSIDPALAARAVAFAFLLAFGPGLAPAWAAAPEELRVRDLLTRLDGRNAPMAAPVAVREVILANNPTVNGEATALYLSRLIRPLNVRVTRIATGVPVGGDLDYADQITISRALEGRREI